MKRFLLLVVFSLSFLFADMNLQTATKEELMAIKGIGEKKAVAIIKYRKTNKINSADDLINIKGFGPKLIGNVKSNKTVAKKKTTNKDNK
jgi:competence protein ComEA